MGANGAQAARHHSWGNLNFSRTATGISKWLWVIIEGYLSYILPKFEHFVPTGLGSGALYIHARNYTLHPVQVEIPLESTRMPCRATRRTPRLSSGTWWPCTRPSRTRRSERSTIACSLRYRIFLMKFLDYSSFRLLILILSID